jgi:hypothetical protein
MVSASLAEWKSTQRKFSGACWAEMGVARASVAAIRAYKGEYKTSRISLGYRREAFEVGVICLLEALRECGEWKLERTAVFWPKKRQNQFFRRSFVAYVLRKLL